MSGFHLKGDGRYVGPTIEDCEKLWTAIIKELVSDATIEVRLPILPLGQDRPKVLVSSPGLDPVTGGERPHVWATMELAGSAVAFTYANLHRMLVTAHNNMEAFLAGQLVIGDDPPF